MRKPSLKEDVDRYGTVKMLLKQLAAEEEVLNKRIKETLEARGKVGYAASTYAVQVSDRAAPELVNKQKLLDTYGELELARLGILHQGKPSKVLTVTPVLRKPAVT